MNPVIYRLKNWRAYKDKLCRLFMQLPLVKNMLGGILWLSPEVSCRYYSSSENRWYSLGLLSCRLVTDAGVAFLVDDWDDNTTDITNFNYHDSGTGTNAEAVGDTALQTPTAEARDAGAKTQPLAYQIRTVATHTYAGTFAITEHGIFSASTAGTLWDRSKFTAINVTSGDKIEFTYTLTVSSGG